MSDKKDFQFKAEHKSDKGGLTEAGRKAYNKATGSNLKPPQPEVGLDKSRSARVAKDKQRCTTSTVARTLTSVSAKPENAGTVKSRRRL